MKIKYILIISFLIIFSCKKDHHLTFNDPGFAVSDYVVNPKDSVKIEAVAINTPDGFKSITATLEGNGTLSGPFFAPSQGNIKNGYSYFLYIAPKTEATAKISILIDQQNSETTFSKTISIIVKLKPFRTIGEFLKFNEEYSELYSIAQKSSYWNPKDTFNIDGTINKFESYGLNDENWETTFFVIPNGSFQYFLDRIPQGNLKVTSISDISQTIANSIIGSLTMNVVKTNGKRTFDIGDFEIEDNGTGLRMRSFMGNIAVKSSTNQVGQIEQISAKFIENCQFIKSPEGNIEPVKAGSAYIYRLTSHYADIKNMYGSVEPLKSWRADNVISMMAFSDILKAGMNGFDESFNITTARDLFRGSGWWTGTMFIPIDSLVVNEYKAKYPAIDYIKVWTYNNRANIAADQLQFMLNFWAAHNLRTYTKATITDGEHITTKGDTITIVGDLVLKGSKSATIVKTVSWIDGSINQRKTIHVIDGLLY